ncbi:MAG TPA: T9SS type A sorting domain-containing protein, partial [Cyclobacteriaceae bacterium]|nr:T9SS type A sorting domain-containing protein [Cyclobacteriaceae bacterium]
TLAQYNNDKEWVFVVAGFDFSSDEENYNFIIGSTFTKNLQIGNVMLSPGFANTFFAPCLEGKMNYYPNPASDKITIRYDGCNERIFRLDLIDAYGKQVASFHPPQSEMYDLTGIGSGVLIVRAFLSNGEIFQFKILKTSP